MGLDLERRWLAEKQANLITYKDSELLFQREIVRNWPEEIDASIEDGVSYLREFTSADNNTAQQFVTDPQATQLEYTGVWRQVSVEKTTADNEYGAIGLTGIVQTLRFGFAQRLNWDEARIINPGTSLMPGNASTVAGIGLQDTTSDDPEDYLMVQWVNLNPEYTRVMSLGTDASTYLAGDTVVDPVIRGVTYTGTWNKILVSTGESALGDGSGTITVLLAQPQYTLNGYRAVINLFTGGSRTDEVHYLWNVPKQLAQGILDAYKALGSGRTGSASYGANNLVNLVLGDTSTVTLGVADDVSGGACSFVETETFYWGVYDPTGGVYNITGHDKYQSPGWTVTKGMSLVKADGLFDITITARHHLLRNYDYKLTERAPLRETQLYQQFGVQAANGSDLMAVPASALGWLYRRDIAVQPDCSKNVQLTAAQSVAKSLYFAHPGRDGAVWGWMYSNHRAWPTAGLAALDGTRLNSVSPSINLDGTYDILIRTSPPPSSWGSTGASPSDFYYSHFEVRTVKWQDGDVGARAEIAGYRTEGFYHHVTFHNTEALARAQAALGWQHGRIIEDGGQWRSDSILGTKVQTANGIDVLTGIGAGTGALAFPATS